ncbi:MAG TPA: phosphotransferase [Acidimicrobiales bacterium]|jgi:hypothetical protein|nr:phosphotransferase [Acidimicrobiales bacterium]
MTSAVWDPDDVTPAWLQAVLEESGALRKGTIAAVDAQPIGTGQVGSNVRYRLTYSGETDGPASVVGKFASRSEDSRAAGVQTLTYETEVAFYRDLADSVQVSRPHCYFADIEPGTANVVLLLEDISDGVAGDQIAGCSDDEAMMVVLEAAKLHGPRWGDPTLTKVPWLAAKIENAFAPGPAVGMMWPLFLDRYQDRLSEQSLEVGAKLAAAETWLAPDPAAMTICHCDYRLDNMLFSDSAGSRPLTIVDWQTVQLGTGVADVSYFISAAMPADRRRATERDLVAGYHSRLVDLGVAEYEFDQCWDDYRRHSFSGFFMAVFASMVVGRTDRGDTMFMTMANGASAQVMDLGALEFLA